MGFAMIQYLRKHNANTAKSAKLMTLLDKSLDFALTLRPNVQTLRFSNYYITSYIYLTYLDFASQTLQTLRELCLGGSDIQQFEGMLPYTNTHDYAQYKIQTLRIPDVMDKKCNLGMFSKYDKGYLHLSPSGFSNAMNSQNTTTYRAIVGTSEPTISRQRQAQDK